MGPEQDLLDDINGNDDYEVIQSKFISTLRVLFESEGISTFTDFELSQWLKVADYHIARAQELIALTLVIFADRNGDENSEPMKYYRTRNFRSWTIKASFSYLAKRLTSQRF